jgi:hypothetical protein
MISENEVLSSLGVLKVKAGISQLLLPLYREIRYVVWSCSPSS